MMRTNEMVLLMVTILVLAPAWPLIFHAVYIVSMLLPPETLEVTVELPARR